MKPYKYSQFTSLKSTYFSKRKVVLLFCLLFTFQLSHGQIVGPGDWSSVRLYGHAYDINDFTAEEYDWIANHFYYFTIEKRHAKNIYGDVSSERASAETAAKIVENNSNTHPLFYWNTKVVYDAIYETIQPKIAENPQWSSSSTGGGSWTDAAYADPEFRTWFVDVVKDMVNNYAHDGVFLDAALSVGGHISPTAGAYLEDMLAEMPSATIFNGFGPNTIYARFDYLDVTEGVFLEHFFKSQCNTLAKGKKMLDDLLLVPNDKIILANAGPESTFWNTTDHKFSLAAFLIIANDNSYYHWMPSSNNWSSDYLMFWDDDFGKYIGSPQGVASVNGYVYTREFENASVTIDLENKTSSIVWGSATGTNLALNGTASQSTTAYGGEASRAIDGDTNGSWSGGSVTHTEAITNSYWQVDLGSDHTIGDVNIFNRTDACCDDRLSDFTVIVIDEAGNFNFTQRITTIPDPFLTVDAGGVTGKVVRIRSNSVNTALSLAEVQVFGESTGGSSGTFVPDPSKTYYIDCPVWDLRLAASGSSEDAYTTSISTTGNDVEWKFVDKGNGYWHIDRAAGGTKPRLRTDGTANADMNQTAADGTNTYYEFTEGASSGTYFLTLPDGAANFNRLQIDNNEVVKMVSTASAGSWESFTITEASTGTRFAENILAASEEASRFNIYPNPVLNSVTINIGESQAAKVDIINEAGQIILSRNIEEGSTSIDLGQIPRGIYIIRVTNGEQVKTQKIIRE